MARKDNIWIKKLDVEIYMLDPYNFDARHEIILSYVDQQMRSMEIIPAEKTLIPTSIAGSSGIIKIVKKSPASACRLPPFTDPSKYLDIVVTKVTNQRQFSKWQYTPSMAEPLWVDDVQIRNAKLLKTYLTDSSFQKMSPLIFMDGAPGTGKSMIIDHVLNDVKDQFSILKQVSFTSSFIGETANQIMDVTKEVIQRAPAILLLEEADGVFMSRWTPDIGSGSTRSHIEEVMSTMLQAIDEMAKVKGVYIIATTNLNLNDQYTIDPAIKSRIGLRLSFRTPTEASITKVTKQLCERSNVSYEMVQKAMSEIVGKRKPSYRDITAAISRAHLMERAGISIPVNDDKMGHLMYIQ